MARSDATKNVTAIRKKAILDAAKRLFFHYGPQKTTMHDIARAAQCAVGSVYLDFPSKEAILGELSAAEWDGVLEAMEKAARAKATAALGERLGYVLEERTRAFFAVARAGTHTPELFHCHMPCVHDARARFEEKERDLFARLLREGNTAAPIQHYARIAQTIQRCLRSLSPPSIFELEDDKARELTRDVSDLLVHGVSRQATEPTSKKARKSRAP